MVQFNEIHGAGGSGADDYNPSTAMKMPADLYSVSWHCRYGRTSVCSERDARYKEY